MTKVWIVLMSDCAVIKDKEIIFYAAGVFVIQQMKIIVDEYFWLVTTRMNENIVIMGIPWRKFEYSRWETVDAFRFFWMDTLYEEYQLWQGQAQSGCHKSFSITLVISTHGGHRGRDKNFGGVSKSRNFFGWKNHMVTVSVMPRVGHSLSVTSHLLYLSTNYDSARTQEHLQK